MDPSWCPGCDRLILPKRYVIPLAPPTTTPSQPEPDTLPPDDPEHDPNHPPPPPAPTPVPSSPEVRKKPLNDHTRNLRNGGPRARGLGGGLVYGTGRVRPGGGLRPRPALVENKKPAVVPPPPQDPIILLPGNPTAARIATADPYFPRPPPTSAPSRKTRVVISQEPTPLYCSDECRARDLKNSFLDSESLSFSGAPAAVHHVAQLERVAKTVQDFMETRRASASSAKSRPSKVSSLPEFPERVQHPDRSRSLIEPPCKLTRTISSNSTASASSAVSSSAKLPESKNSTVRASSSKHRSRPALPMSTSSLKHPTTAPPASSSPSSTSSLSAASALFEDDEFKRDDRNEDDNSSATTPSRRGSGSSGASKKEKRVSFVNEKPYEDWRANLRRRNPLLDANPLRHGISLSPKDRVKCASLPSELLSTPSNLRASISSPALVVDTTPPSASNQYGVAMWPEDEKRTTESAHAHGALLRDYAMRFKPREGRSLVWGRMWEGREEREERVVSRKEHEAQPDSRREYWRVFEEREAEGRARRKAQAALQREEEERVISELLGGSGMKEEDQPQARRMNRMAYDGMPGPAEHRGLTYKFDRFLYPLLQPKPTIVEKTIRRWDEDRREWIEEIIKVEVEPERKKLFNFVED